MTFRSTFEMHRKKIVREFLDRAWNPFSGQEIKTLRKNCIAHFAASEGQSIERRRADVMVYLLDEGQIEVQTYECFADQLRHEDIMNDITWSHYRKVRAETKVQLQPFSNALESRAFTGDIDFGHTCPDWRSLLSLGIPGIVRRLSEYREKVQQPEQTEFYDCSIQIYEAMMRLMKRLSDEANSKAAEGNHMAQVAQNLRNLTERSPQTLHEALQLSTLYYFLQQEIERSNVRSLGRFDLLFGSFFEADLAAGRLSRDEAKALLQYYFVRWNARDVLANIPITLCGTTDNGREVTSDFTRLVLEAYGELNIVSPKFHIRYSPDMPTDVLMKVLALIRCGVSSFVFCNDQVVESAMTKIGQSKEDAEDYVMVGCYESTSMGREIACTCNGRISFLKAVEYAMTDGIDLMNGKKVGISTETPTTFEAFVEKVHQQLFYLADACIERISLLEEQYPRAFSAPLFSGTLLSCVEKGQDAYNRGAKYNNSSINVFGIANAADALAVIRKVVYTDRQLTLSQFTEILTNNWQGHENLRLHCRNFSEKYGNNNPDVDELASDLMHAVASRINGTPNGRGGVFRTGAFSIDWRFEFGEHNAASADGRSAGDTLSKNACACIGMDKQGVTALVLSAAQLDATEIPNGAVLDIMLHESAVTGQEGLNAMYSLLVTYMSKGGQCLQCNVLSAETMKQAQAEPEKFPTLQVRLCGWNVLFINLSEKEQNELIQYASA